MAKLLSIGLPIEVIRNTSSRLGDPGVRSIEFISTKIKYL